MQTDPQPWTGPAPGVLGTGAQGTASPPSVLPYRQPATGFRPAAVTVLAILGIIYAAVSILNHGAGVVVFVTGVVPLAGPPEMRAWNLLNSSGSLTLSLVLLYASVSCLKMRPWGRRWVVGYAWAYLAWLVVVVAVSVLWVIPRAVDSLPPGARQTAVLSRAYAAAAVSGLVFTAWPVVLLVFMTRESVKTAFGQSTSAPRAAASPDRSEK